MSRRCSWGTERREVSTLSTSLCASPPSPRHSYSLAQVGFGKAEATLVVALLCLSVSVCAYPLGRLDDKYGPR